MKKYFILLPVIAFLLSACKKESETTPAANTGNSSNGLVTEKKNRALLIDFSEDWCPPCGNAGGPAFDSLRWYEGNLLNLVKVYGTSNNPDLNCSIASGWWSSYNTPAYGGSGIPKFIVGNLYQPVYNGNIPGTIQQTINKATAFNNDTVVAAVALRKTISGLLLRVDTKVEFYEPQAAGSDLRLALYAVETDIVSEQDTSYTFPPDPGYVHHNVVRLALGTDYAGININGNQAITAGQAFEKTYSLLLNPAWNPQKIKVVAVLWKMNTTPAMVLNSNLAQ